jgi:hypothetical protein
MTTQYPLIAQPWLRPPPWADEVTFDPSTKRLEWCKLIPVPEEETDPPSLDSFDVVVQRRDLLSRSAGALGWATVLGEVEIDLPRMQLDLDGAGWLISLLSSLCEQARSDNDSPPGGEL